MTVDRIPALLEPIQHRLNAATPGPWEVMDVNDPGEGVNCIDVYAETDGLETVCKLPNPADYSMREYLQQDAEFIANAPTDQARLLAAVQAVTALHRPERGTVHDPDDGETKEMDYCDTCSDSQWLDEATAVAYPCPTVSAVVAALGGEADV